MTTGRFFAAKPRSASHTSPGWGLIENVEHFLLAGAGAHQINDIMVGEFD